jgi:hypothetical protein
MLGQRATVSSGSWMHARGWSLASSPLLDLICMAWGHCLTIVWTLFHVRFQLCAPPQLQVHTCLEYYTILILISTWYLHSCRVGSPTLSPHYIPISHSHSRRSALQWQRNRTCKAFAHVELSGNSLVPFTEDTYGCLGQPAMRLLHILENGAAGGCVTRAPFAAGALRELSVGLLKGGFFMYPACVGMFASLSWTGFRPGMVVPRDEQVAQPVNCTCRHFGDL